MAERVGFEPTVHLLGVQPISSRPRYSRFGTSPVFTFAPRKKPGSAHGTRLPGFPGSPPGDDLTADP
jgi:hypothetical protein